eukprot:CAMPEP_0117443908 /NCGR_PEP_ID=MMETSP0759-20121206/4953_1 /TAXON_ID=63605 /ORGANISM="Percolomonas cosmopolitus, Strain WS" /LENGTH=1104 /DNA_ID=CAMNT_0005235929 /DNA_START=168 /DNA_END=3482 /DNA_ORIENTATION=+
MTNSKVVVGTARAADASKTNRGRTMHFRYSPETPRGDLASSSSSRKASLDSFSGGLSREDNASFQSTNTTTPPLPPTNAPSQSSTHRQHPFSYSLNNFNDFHDDVLLSYDEKDVVDTTDDWEVDMMMKSFLSHASPLAESEVDEASKQDASLSLKVVDNRKRKPFQGLFKRSASKRNVLRRGNTSAEGLIHRAGGKTAMAAHLSSSRKHGRSLARMPTYAQSSGASSQRAGGPISSIARSPLASSTHYNTLSGPSSLRDMSSPRSITQKISSAIVDSHKQQNRRPSLGHGTRMATATEHNWHENVSPQGTGNGTLYDSGRHVYPEAESTQKSPSSALSEISGLSPLSHRSKAHSPSKGTSSLEKSAIYSELFSANIDEEQSNSTQNSDYVRSLVKLNQKSMVRSGESSNASPNGNIPSLRIDLEKDHDNNNNSGRDGSTRRSLDDGQYHHSLKPLDLHSGDAFLRKMVDTEGEDDDDAQNDIINTLARNDWMDNWNTKSLELKNKNIPSATVSSQPASNPSRNNQVLNPSTADAHINLGRGRLSRPKRKRNTDVSLKKSKFGSMAASAKTLSSHNNPMLIDEWRHNLISTSPKKASCKSSLKPPLKRNQSGNAIASTNSAAAVGTKKRAVRQPITTDELVSHVQQGDTVLQVLERRMQVASQQGDNYSHDHLTPSSAAQEPQFPRRHSQTFPSTEVVLPSLGNPTEGDSQDASNLSSQRHFKKLAKKYGLKQYKEKLKSALVPVQKDGRLDYYALNFQAQNKKLKFQRPYVSRYEWKTRLYDEYSQFLLFANSISLHFPKKENWKRVYHKAKQNDITLFIFIFLSPKTPCSAISLLNHMSKVVEYEKHVGFLDTSTHLRRTTHLNPNGTLKKNCIPPHSQYLVRFLKACQDKHTTLLMNNMALKEVDHLLMKDIGERNIKYLIDDEDKIRVFAWLYAKQQHKLYVLVSPTLTLYLPCFYNERHSGSFDFKFSWVLTNNHLLNLGRGRIRGAVGLLGGGSALEKDGSGGEGSPRVNAEADYTARGEDTESQMTARGEGSRGSGDGGSRRSRRKKPSMLNRDNIFRMEATFGAPERIQLTNIRSGSMKNLLEEAEDADPQGMEGLM